MSDLGQLLIKARNEKGLTIDDLQETTKIRKAYLEAIEEGNYKKLPGNFYVRAFIKSYAEAVGLEPDEVLTMYKNVIPAASYEQAHIEPVRRSRSGTVASEKISNLALFVIMWLFILLIGGIIYVYIDSKYDGNNNKTIDDTRITDKLDGADNAEEEPVVQATQAPATPTATPTPAPGVVSLVTSTAKLDTYTISGSDKLIIQVKLMKSVNCWLQLDKDNKGGTLVEMSTLNKDDTLRTWELDHSAYLNVGRGDAVEVTVNGTVINTGVKVDSKKMQFNLVK